MNSAINLPAATERVAELRRRASGRDWGSRFEGADTPAIELKVVGGRESEVLRRLAALDEAPELEGQVLIAVVDGDAVAALSLRDQRVVANPFAPTSEAVELLRLRSQQLLGAPARRRRRLLGPRAA